MKKPKGGIFQAKPDRFLNENIKKIGDSTVYWNKSIMRLHSAKMIHALGKNQRRHTRY